METSVELLEIVRAFKRQAATWQAQGLNDIPLGDIELTSAPSTSTQPTVELNERPTLAEIEQKYHDCQRCGLGATRTHFVFGVGNPAAELVFVGEAPGRDEDLQGEPFVGAAGQLLTKMINAMGLERSDVYICNIVKCRPPNNRNPESDEMEKCAPILKAQLGAIAPRVMVALGNVAAKALLQTDVGITRLRGRFHDYGGVPLMPTFHPAYLLRNAEGKKPAWDDLQMVMAEMDRLNLRRRRKS